MKGGTAAGADGDRGCVETGATVDCLSAVGRHCRPHPGNSTLCSDGRSRKRLPPADPDVTAGPGPAAPSMAPSLPAAVAPAARMSVVDDSPEMTSLLLDDVTYTPTLLLLHDVIVPWLWHNILTSSCTHSAVHYSISATIKTSNFW